MISIENRDSVAEAAAFRLGIHEGLSDSSGGKMVAVAKKVVKGKAFYVLRFTGWPDAIDNGWQLITAPAMPEFVRLIEGMIWANYSAKPIVKRIPQPGRN